MNVELRNDEQLKKHISQLLKKQEYKKLDQDISDWKRTDLEFLDENISYEIQKEIKVSLQVDKDSIPEQASPVHQNDFMLDDVSQSTVESKESSFVESDFEDLNDDDNSDKENFAQMQEDFGKSEEEEKKKKIVKKKEVEMSDNNQKKIVNFFS